METLTQRIEAAAALGGSITFIDGDDHHQVGWAELHEQAKAMACELQQRHGIAARRPRRRARPHHP